VTISQARAHLVELQAAGVGYRQAAKLAGVSVQTVRHIRAGKPRAVKPDTLAAILGVKVRSWRRGLWSTRMQRGG
jgi:hypothetical protein